jgi:hypothetical protein
MFSLGAILYRFVSFMKKIFKISQLLTLEAVLMAYQFLTDLQLGSIS